MVYLANNPYRDSDIYHHGIKGQLWGVRRFQNPDGTLTEEGKRRYKKFYNDDGSLSEKGQKKFDKMSIRLKKLDSKRDKAFELKAQAEAKKHRIDKSYIRKLFSSEQSMDKLDQRIDTYGDRYNAAVIKGKKYIKKMERMFGSDLVSSIYRPA